MARDKDAPRLIERDTGADRWPRELRQQMILEAAGACFSKFGYEGTSISNIVERAGGSIATIYTMFGSKRGLFDAFVQDRAELLNVSIAYHGREQGPEHKLIYIAERILDHATRSDWLDLLRLVISEVPRDPGLGSFLRRAALDPIENTLRTVFRDWVWLADGSAADPGDLSQLFVDLVVGTSPVRLLARLERLHGKRERRKYVARRISSFLQIAEPQPQSAEQTL